MDHALIEKVTHQLEILPDEVITRVLSVMTTFTQRPGRGTPGKHLMRFAGTLRADEAEQMLQTIERDCREVEQDGW